MRGSDRLEGRAAWLLVVALVILVALSACGGGGGGGGEETPPGDPGDPGDPAPGTPLDATGNWTLLVASDPASLNGNIDDCTNGERYEIKRITVSQSGDTLNFTDEDGIAYSGRKEGQGYAFTGSAQEDGFTTTLTGTLTLTDDSHLSGSVTFRGESGSDYCTWEMDFDGLKQTEDGEGRLQIPADIDDRLAGWWLAYDDDFTTFGGDGIAATETGLAYDLECEAAGVPAESCDWQIDRADLEYAVLGTEAGFLYYRDYELPGPAVRVGGYVFEGDRLILVSHENYYRYLKPYSGGAGFDAAAVDDDGDGFSENQGDVDDADGTIHPDATEVCGDGIDQDCDGSDLPCDTPEGASDIDRDGFTEAEGDCDDDDGAVYPGAYDICEDGIDQDCDGVDPVCGGVQCCECAWSCYFVNNYGSGTANSTATIRTTGSFYDCDAECFDAATAPSSDCVSNINITVAHACGE